MKAPDWLKLSKPRREGDHAVVDVAVRERVFVLAASVEQADLFTRRWLAENPDRRRQDAIYLHGNVGGLMGHMILPTDRLVGVEGYYRHPRHTHIMGLALLATGCLAGIVLLGWLG